MYEHITSQCVESHTIFKTSVSVITNLSLNTNVPEPLLSALPITIVGATEYPRPAFVI